jgi:hypothetical protein
MLEYIVTCHTENCGNAEASIEISSEDTEPTVICGVCCIQIEDVKTKPAPKKSK